MAPSRSTNCTIINNTSLTLNLKSSGCSHGQWTLNLGPPNTIPANDNKSFQGESAGIMTGVQGWAKYGSPDGDFQFDFDNPFSGSNSYSHSAPPNYSIKREGGWGDNAHVTWTIQHD